MHCVIVLKICVTNSYFYSTESLTVEFSISGLSAVTYYGDKTVDKL